MKNSILKNIIENEELNNTEKIMIISLGIKAKDNYVEISFAEIANETNTSRRIVMYNIRNLVAKGILEKERRFETNSGNLRNRYKITI